MIFSELRDLDGNRQDFISLVLAPLKCLVTTLLLSLDSYQPLMYFTKESPSITVTGSFFVALFFFIFVSFICYLLILLFSTVAGFYVFLRSMFFWEQMVYLGNDDVIVPFRYIIISKGFVPI